MSVAAETLRWSSSQRLWVPEKLSIEETLKRSGKTAIKRKKVSAPMRRLLERDLLVGDVLDYGCGFGYDADTLGFAAYDVNHRPKFPWSVKFNTITMIYVLNTLPSKLRRATVRNARRLLMPGGHLYAAWRLGIVSSVLQNSNPRATPLQTNLGTLQFPYFPEYATDLVMTPEPDLSESGRWIMLHTQQP